MEDKKKSNPVIRPDGTAGSPKFAMPFDRSKTDSRILTMTPRSVATSHIDRASMYIAFPFQIILG